MQGNIVEIESDVYMIYYCTLNSLSVDRNKAGGEFIYARNRVFELQVKEMNKNLHFRFAFGMQYGFSAAWQLVGIAIGCCGFYKFVALLQGYFFVLCFTKSCKKCLYNSPVAYKKAGKLRNNKLVALRKDFTTLYSCFRPNISSRVLLAKV